MKQLLCRLAWWILWKWWPDRVVMHWSAADWDTGRRYLREYTVDEWHRIHEQGLFDTDSIAYIKLDHQGERLSP